MSWRPIGTAPLRAAVIVHHAAHWTRLACLLEDGSWMEWPGPAYDGFLLSYSPTHWHPLPAPPTTEGE